MALGNQLARWADPSSLDAAWDTRTSMIAQMIPEGSSVLEFGSGREILEGLLPPACTYQPADMVARSPRTLVCDLNDEFPRLAQHYDVVVFSGVIEYIHDLPQLFRHVRAITSQCIVSYATTDHLDCIATRQTNGWVHHLSEVELIRMVEEVGFRVQETKPWQQQTIFRLI